MCGHDDQGENQGSQLLFDGNQFTSTPPTSNDFNRLKSLSNRLRGLDGNISITGGNS